MKEVTNNKGIKVAFITTLIYIFTMGIGMLLMNRVFNYSYEQPEMVEIIFFVEIVLIGIVVFTTNRYYSWKTIGFKKLNLKQIGWFIPHTILILTMVSMLMNQILENISNITSSQFMLIVIVAITTLLVGFSEEVMFRGILLHSFTNKGKIYTGFIVSSVMFSLLHSVNVFGGMPAQSMIGQLFSSLMLGLLFAPLAIRLNNIIPLIIYHWLWDFTLISFSVIEKSPTILPAIVMLLNIAIGLILWIFAKSRSSR